MLRHHYQGALQTSLQGWLIKIIKADGSIDAVNITAYIKSPGYGRKCMQILPKCICTSPGPPKNPPLHAGLHPSHDFPIRSSVCKPTNTDNVSWSFLGNHCDKFHTALTSLRDIGRRDGMMPRSPCLECRCALQPEPLT